MQGGMARLPIFQCFRLRRLDPDREAFVFVNDDNSAERVRYGDIFENTNRISHMLLRAGLGEGDTFALMMRNHPEFLYALFAALSVGAIAVPIDPRSRGPQLAFQIRNAKCKGIIVADEFVEGVEEMQVDIRDVPILGVLYKRHHGIPVSNAHPVLNEILENESADPPRGMKKFRSAAPAQIIHTSGTTGDPKGVVLNASRFRAYGVLARLVFRYRRDDVLYTGLSMTHGNAQSVTVFPSLSIRSVKGVVSERFTKSRIWDICRAHGCTSFSLLGGMMSGICNEPPTPDDADNPVRVVISAGTPRAIWRDFEKRFAVRIHEWYGAIEGGLAHNPPGKGPIGSFGKPNPLLYRMKVVDENGKSVPPQVRGELISRMTFGKTRVNYLGKKRESREKTRGGWLRSGDICHRDERGFFYFDFRKGGGLRRQGEFIQPDAVEKVIGQHRGVSEVCVFGIPAASGAPGESDLVAAIAPFSGVQIDAGDIRDLCLSQLERNAVPSFLQIVDEIPKTISEKHLDRVLIEAFRPDAPNVTRIT